MHLINANTLCSKGEQSTLSAINFQMWCSVITNVINTGQQIKSQLKVMFTVTILHNNVTEIHCNASKLLL